MIIRVFQSLLSYITDVISGIEYAFSKQNEINGTDVSDELCIHW